MRPRIGGGRHAGSGPDRIGPRHTAKRCSLQPRAHAVTRACRQHGHLLDESAFPVSRDETELRFDTLILLDMLPHVQEVRIVAGVSGAEKQDPRSAGDHSSASHAGCSASDRAPSAAQKASRSPNSSQNASQYRRLNTSAASRPTRYGRRRSASAARIANGAIARTSAIRVLVADRHRGQARAGRGRRWCTNSSASMSMIQRLPPCRESSMS